MMKALLSLWLFVLMFSGYAQCPKDIFQTTIAPTNNLILHLPFDGNLNNLGSGSYTISQSGGTYTSSVCGQGMLFDGLDDYVQVTPSMNLIGDFTITAWVTPNTLTNWMGIFSEREQCATTYRGFTKAMLGVSYYNVPDLSYQVNITTSCTTGSGGDRYVNAATSVPANQPSFVAVTVQTNNTETRTVTLYVNCEEYTTTMSLNLPTTSAFNAGLNYITSIGSGSTIPGFTDTFDGVIDDLRVYGSVLTHSDLLDIYHACQPLNLSVSNSPECALDSAVILLDNTQNDVVYQLFDVTNNILLGSPINGTCGTIQFNTGAYPNPNNFVVVATHINSGCTINLDSTLTTSPTVSNLFGSQTHNLCDGDSLLINNQYILNNTVIDDTVLSISGCDSIVTHTVIFNPSPSIELGPDTTLCPNENLLLDASNVNALWQNSSTSQYFPVSSSGTYFASLSANGCVGYDTIDVSYFSSATGFPEDTLEFCSGIDLVVSAFASSSSYLWSTGDTIDNITVSLPGLYWLELEQNGCLYRDSITLVSLNDLPSISVGDNIDICLGEIAEIVATGSSYSTLQWNTGDSSNIIYSDINGLFIVEASNMCGSVSDSMMVTISDCNCYVYVPNAFTPNNDNINDNFKVVSNCILNDIRLIIFNRWGEVIYESTDQLEGWDGTFNGFNSPDDIYVWKMSYLDPSGGVVNIEKRGHITLLR